jgi:hypothetical protein
VIGGVRSNSSAALVFEPHARPPMDQLWRLSN